MHVIQGTERECMSRVILEGERDRDSHALSQNRSGTILMRCGCCGLEWESAHYKEGCPLRELEKAFLSENWFMVSSKAAG